MLFVIEDFDKNLRYGIRWAQKDKNKQPALFQALNLWSDLTIDTFYIVVSYWWQKFAKI